MSYRCVCQPRSHGVDSGCSPWAWLCSHCHLKTMGLRPKSTHRALELDSCLAQEIKGKPERVSVWSWIYRFNILSWGGMLNEAASVQPQKRANTAVCAICRFYFRPNSSEYADFLPSSVSIDLKFCFQYFMLSTIKVSHAMQKVNSLITLHHSIIRLPYRNFQSHGNFSRQG